MLCCAMMCSGMLFPLCCLCCCSQIKNARTQLAQRLREIRARVRVIISGKTARRAAHDSSNMFGTVRKHHVCVWELSACMALLITQVCIFDL